MVDHEIQVVDRRNRQSSMVSVLLSRCREVVMENERRRPNEDVERGRAPDDDMIGKGDKEFEEVDDTDEDQAEGDQTSEE